MEAAPEISEMHKMGGVLLTSGFAFVHNIDVYYQLQGTTPAQSGRCQRAQRGSERRRHQFARGETGDSSCGATRYPLTR